jgi:polysaccharide biosynthesis protein PslH
MSSRTPLPDTAPPADIGFGRVGHAASPPTAGRRPSIVSPLHRLNMTRDLYISTYAPALGTGRAQRTYTCVRALALLGPLDLAYVPHGAVGPSPEYEAIEGLKMHAIRPSRGARRAARYALTRARGVPDKFARGVSPELVRDVARLVAEPGRGRVVAGDLSAAAALLAINGRHPIIYNAHNVESLRVWPRRRPRPLARMKLRSYERRLLTTAAETWMVSRADVQAARQLVASARLRYVPNVVDVAAIRPRTDAHRVSPDGGQLLMVGDFTYAPNRAGRDLLVNSVMPLVWRARPEARVTLAGRALEGWPAPDPRIEVAGFVEDLAAVYEQADCVVVPINEGAGTPLKFVEALAHRVPVVATPFAARGLEVVAGRHYLEGADAESFAAAVIEALSTGARDVAAAGRRIAETEYSLETLAERIAA